MSLNYADVSVTSTAPGKTILFGEHAVVYGQPAIAVPITQVQARVEIAPLTHSQTNQIQIDAPGIGLSSSFADLPPGDPIALAITLALQSVSPPSTPSMQIRITSSIPVAGGLGSGAAVSVALIRAVSTFLGKPLPDGAVSALAYEVEKIHHGTPSGIDNTVITYCRPVFFTRGKPIEIIQMKSPFHLVIGDTGIASRTGQVVANVRAKHEMDPGYLDSLFAEIGGIARSALRCMQEGQAEQLGRLMTQNHGLLQHVGVSGPELDRLVHAALSGGAWGAKLSGAGRGGNMIAIAPPDAVEQVASALKNAGAVHTFMTKVGSG